MVALTTQQLIEQAKQIGAQAKVLVDSNPQVAFSGTVVTPSLTGGTQGATVGGSSK